jgi:Tubulin-tyrosine ligase family
MLTWKQYIFIGILLCLLWAAKHPKVRFIAPFQPALLTNVHAYSEFKPTSDFLCVPDFQYVDSYLQSGDISNYSLKPHAWIYGGFYQMDSIASKKNLWNHWSAEYQQDGFLPKTWDLTKKEDIHNWMKTYESFQNEMDFPTFYLKKDVQARQGIKRSKSFFEIQKEIETNRAYQVLQEGISPKDAYQLDEYPINARMYFVVLYDSKRKQWTFTLPLSGYWVYSHSRDEPITGVQELPDSFYTDMLTLHRPKHPFSLQIWLQNEEPDRRAKWLASLETLFRRLSYVTSSYLKPYDPDTYSSFMIFGIDLLPMRDCTWKLLEVNKGPDMYYSKTVPTIEDQAIKRSIIRDVQYYCGWTRNKAIPDSFSIVM